MKIIGIIAEYNPFHLGHLYQINKIKEAYPDSIIVTIVSSTFTQRGDISIINKWNKTRILLNNNIDLIIELPFVYASQSSDIFAKGALEILNHLKIDTLVFGTEYNNIETLKELANIQLTNNNYDNIVKKYLNTGLNYPTALSKALKDICNINISSPNDLLGLSYVKEIIKNNYNINPITIKRTNNYHSKSINSNIINATLIRELFREKKEIKEFIPNYSNDYLYRNSINDFYNLFKYNVIINKDNLKNILSVDEGIENRLLKYINIANNFDELTKLIKTKRYTYNKINRMYVHILNNLSKKDNNIDIDYIRVLGFNKNGKEYLNRIKKSINIPFVTNYKKNLSKLLDIELKATSIYSMIIDNQLLEQEYKNKPIIK